MFTRARDGPVLGRIHEGAAMPMTGAPLNKEVKKKASVCGEALLSWSDG